MECMNEINGDPTSTLIHLSSSIGLSTHTRVISRNPPTHVYTTILVWYKAGLFGRSRRTFSAPQVALHSWFVFFPDSG